MMRPAFFVKVLVGATMGGLIGATELPWAVVTVCAAGVGVGVFLLPDRWFWS